METKTLVIAAVIIAATAVLATAPTALNAYANKPTSEPTCTKNVDGGGTTAGGCTQGGGSGNKAFTSGTCTTHVMGSSPKPPTTSGECP